MHMRKKKWAENELASCPFYFDSARALSGRWRALFAHAGELHVELGCGKCVSTALLARETPGINYVALDLSRDMLAVARRNIVAAYRETPVNNIVLSCHNLLYVQQIFSPADAVDRLYINFCNPWDQKIHHERRRLVHTRQLLQYRTFLSPARSCTLKQTTTRCLTLRSATSTKAAFPSRSSRAICIKVAMRPTTRRSTSCALPRLACRSSFYKPSCNRSRRNGNGCFACAGLAMKRRSAVFCSRRQPNERDYRRPAGRKQRLDRYIASAFGADFHRPGAKVDSSKKHSAQRQASAAQRARTPRGRCSALRARRAFSATRKKARSVLCRFSLEAIHRL